MSGSDAKAVSDGGAIDGRVAALAAELPPLTDEQIHEAVSILATAAPRQSTAA